MTDPLASSKTGHVKSAKGGPNLVLDRAGGYGIHIVSMKPDWGEVFFGMNARFTAAA